MAGATGGSLLVGEDTGKAGSFTCKRRGGGCRQLTGKKKGGGKKRSGLCGFGCFARGFHAAVVPVESMLPTWVLRIARQSLNNVHVGVDRTWVRP